MNKGTPESAPAAAPRRLLSLAELKRRLGGDEVSEATIYRWGVDGVLPRPIKIGHLNRWWEDEVEAKLAAMERGGPTKKPPTTETPTADATPGKKRSQTKSRPKRQPQPAPPVAER